ncbi:MAG TPA: methyltransferase domain-containing protein [Acidimicrobiales bacterium]|nr:methyltransferase domain-containing protein [Acidimicrobiales bacterium]
MPSLYDGLGAGYAGLRRADPRIDAQIRAALGGVTSVVNVGAGAGSYEPPGTIAVEPSRTMLAQRPAGAAPAVEAVAGALPFADATFDGGMAIFTVHHWPSPAHGLAELRRVVRGPVVVLTWDLVAGDSYWLIDEYLPASRTLDRSLPSPEEVLALLGGAGRVEVVPVPRDCTDGFFAAWWCRPEAYLDPAVRAAISGIARLSAADVEPGIERLRHDLASGAWRRRHHDLLEAETFDAGYRLVVADPPSVL